MEIITNSPSSTSPSPVVSEGADNPLQASLQPAPPTSTSPSPIDANQLPDGWPFVSSPPSPANTPESTVEITVAPSPTPTPIPVQRWYEQPWIWFAGIVALAVVLVITLFLVILRRKRNDVIPSTENMPSIPHHPLLIGNAQHVGSRDNQQDSFGMSDMTDLAALNSRGFLAVLADGMGGLSNGAQLSQSTVTTLLSGFVTQDASIDPSLRLLLLAQQAQSKALQLQTGTSGGSGSTLAAVLVRENELYTLSIGDSRILLYRAGGCIQLNREHVYASELDERVAGGQLAYSVALHDQQRKALTSYVGMPKPMQVDHPLWPIHLLPGDKVVLMSDGVYGTLDENELNNLLRAPAYQAALDIQNAVLMKNKPHQDNLTVVIVEYNE